MPRKKKTRINKRKRNLLAIEALEARRLMAADFTSSASISGLTDHLPTPTVEVQQQSSTLSAADLAKQARQEMLQTRIRTIDGTNNNLRNTELGAADTQLLTTTTVEYSDGISEPAGEDRPSAREISNVIAAQETEATNDRELTDITWLWGQFIDHDIDLTESGEDAESFDIEVPEGDIFFDPTGTGTATISLTRSAFDADTGTSEDNPRVQINEITSYLDGSVIYGSDQERADELRTFEGGLLKTSDGDLLPFNEAGLDNAGGTSDTLFLAGDVRANENAALTAMHTIWVREHNYQAEKLAERNPDLSDQQLYDRAKAIVTAELQSITYNEFLPALLGEGVIDDYSGYSGTVDPSIANVFSTAAYRFGHSMLPTELLRLNEDGTVAEEGNLSLQNAFFAPDEISENGVESILFGATSQLANEIDNQVVDDIRNFLFGAPGSGGFDLASLNIQRGRDHGLADYNQVREDYGLDPVTEFSDISSDPDVAAKLEQLYGTVDNIDVWVGGLAEDHVDGGSLGELFTTVVADQFERIRDGDRFWYQRMFSQGAVRQIENTSLSDVIARNSDIDELRENIFFSEDAADQLVDGDGKEDRTPAQQRRDVQRERLRERYQAMQQRQLEFRQQQLLRRRAARAEMLALASAESNRDVQSDRNETVSSQTSNSNSNSATDEVFSSFGENVV